MLVIVKLVLQGLNTLCAPKWGLLACVALTIGVLTFYIAWSVYEDGSWFEDNQDTAWHLTAAHLSIIIVYLVDLLLYVLFGICAKADPNEGQ